VQTLIDQIKTNYLKSLFFLTIIIFPDGPKAAQGVSPDEEDVASFFNSKPADLLSDNLTSDFNRSLANEPEVPESTDEPPSSYKEYNGNEAIGSRNKKI
jgi:hypothetical protein